jgi:peptidoglycan/LPS O-acetylase OafA/YrhL
MLGQFIIVPLFGLWIVMTYYSKSLFYNNKIMEYLGLISYSFYLWQFAAIELGKKLLKEYPDINIHLIFFFSFMTNVIISMLSYHLVEERARKLIIAKYSAKRSFKVVQTIN